MTYKTRVIETDEATVKAAAGLAIAAPDGTHVVLVRADVRQYAPDRYRIVAVWSTVS